MLSGVGRLIKVLMRDLLENNVIGFSSAPGESAGWFFLLCAAHRALSSRIMIPPKDQSQKLEMSTSADTRPTRPFHCFNSQSNKQDGAVPLLGISASEDVATPRQRAPEGPAAVPHPQRGVPAPQGTQPFPLRQDTGPCHLGRTFISEFAPCLVGCPRAEEPRKRGAPPQGLPSGLTLLLDSCHYLCLKVMAKLNKRKAVCSCRCTMAVLTFLIQFAEG